MEKILKNPNKMLSKLLILFLCSLFFIIFLIVIVQDKAYAGQKEHSLSTNFHYSEYAKVEVDACQRKEDVKATGKKNHEGYAAYSHSDHKLSHGDHTPKHGGIFFMAPNKMHHIESVYSKECGFQLYIYNEYTEPISVIGFQAVIKIIQDKKDEEIEHLLFLSPTKDHMILQSPLIEGHHSDLDLEGALSIELYLKFPGNNVPEEFNF